MAGNEQRAVVEQREERRFTTRSRNRGMPLEGVVWKLRLECGHRVERITYAKPREPHPTLKRARCAECLAARKPRASII
jgi:hypothetical protein